MADPKLKRAETRLEELLRQVDIVVDGLSGVEMIPVGLAMRARDLYKGFKHSLSGAPLVTAAAIVRSLVDIAILTAWLELDEANPELWFAEDDRTSMVAIDAVLELNKRRGHGRTDPYGPGEREEIAAGLAEVRAAARAAGVPIGPKSGALMPNTLQMAEAVPTAWELYLAFRAFSPWVHSAGRSFAEDRVVARSDGHHLEQGFPFNKEQLRAMAVTTMLYLLASVSRQLGLGVEDECDLLRVDLAAWVPAPPSEVV